MYCPRCGEKNRADARFCRICGAQIGEYTENIQKKQSEQSDGSPDSRAPENQSVQKKKKRKIKMRIIGIVFLLSAVGLSTALVAKDQYEKQMMDNSLADGNKYLEEMDYEKAEDAYLEAISIDPKQKDPYLGLIDTYIAMEDYDRVVETAEDAKEMLPEDEHQEFDNIIEKWGNMIEYTWIVDPVIEAEDITYIKSVDTDNYSTNEREKQKGSEYAVIVQEGLLGIVRSDGTVMVEPEYTSIREYVVDQYLMIRAESQYEPSVNSDWNQYFFNEETEEITIAEGLGGGYIDLMGFYYYCNGLHNTNEAYIYLDYQFQEPESPIPVRQSDDIYESSDGYYSDWLQDMYAVYSDGALTTDFIYEECGSESDGVLAAEKDGKWGYITPDGTEVIPFEYDASWKIYSENEDVLYCYAASEGYIPLVKDGEWEMRDTDGELVIPAGLFEEIRPVYNGKCWVKKDGKWGVIQLQDNDISGESSGDAMPQEETPESEDALRELFYDYIGVNDCLYFYYDDFDGDNIYEAFAVVGDEKETTYYTSYENVQIYFVSGDGEILCMNLDDTLYGLSESSKLLSAGSHKYLLWEVTAGGSGSVTYIYGVRDGLAYEPEISGQYMCFGGSLEDMGITDIVQPDDTFVGFTSDFSNGYHEYIPSFFVFDEEDAEFVLYEY